MRGRGEPAQAGQTASAPGDREVRRIASHELFAGANEVIVEHEGDFYRLRCTSKGKLILTK